MPSLVEFVLARIGEREEWAQAAHDRAVQYRGGGWRTEWAWVCSARNKRRGHNAADSFHADGAPSPADVLRQCEAERRIVAEWQEAERFYAERPKTSRGEAAGIEFAVKCLALPYADHPDYRVEWAP